MMCTPVTCDIGVAAPISDVISVYMLQPVDTHKQTQKNTFKYIYIYSSYPNFKVVAWLTAKVSALLAFKYPAVDLAAWRKASEGASNDTHAALSRDEQIKAIQDADRARGDKVSVPH